LRAAPDVAAPLYVIGAEQKDRKLDEWHQYKAAIVLRVEPASGKIEVCHSYTSPPEVCPSLDPSFSYKACTRLGNRLYLCTSTEVFTYEVPGFRRLGYVSLACFNDVHHVAPTPSGNLLVVSTGLDMLLEITPAGRILDQWNVLGGDRWGGRSPDVDYRKVPTTKPHPAHPNHVCVAGGRYWVSRFYEKDCVAIQDPSRRLPFEGPPHDGVPAFGRVYFTTTDGGIPVADEASMTLVEYVDLNLIGGQDVALGWCRGILPVADDLCWIGFTRIRPTKLRDNLSWVRRGFRQYWMPTRIALYDLGRRKLLREIILEDFRMNAVFSIVAAP